MDSSLIYFLLTDGSTADNGSSNKTTNSAFSDFWSLTTAYRALAKLIRCKTKKYFQIISDKTSSSQIRLVFQQEFKFDTVSAFPTRIPNQKVEKKSKLLLPVRLEFWLEKHTAFRIHKKSRNTGQNSCLKNSWLCLNSIEAFWYRYLPASVLHSMTSLFRQPQFGLHSAIV